MKYRNARFYKWVYTVPIIAVTMKGDKGMRRKICFVVAVLFVFSVMRSSSVALAAAPANISISYFENFTIDGESLTATKSEKITVRGETEVTLTATALSVAAQGVKGKTFDISVPICNGAFVNPVDNNGNYDVLSVIDMGEAVRLVLKEKNARNMLYVDVRLDSVEKRERYENYNINWYKMFVGGTIVLEEETTTEQSRSSTSYTTRLYGTMNNIYGDLYKEYIRIIAMQEYPSTINNSTGGNFLFTLGIQAKWTEYTPYGGNVVITDGCSLGMNCAEINLSTPKGEYFSSMNVEFSGDLNNYQSPISIGFNLDIPATPFSITYSYPYNSNGSGRTYYKAFPATSNKVTQTGNTWDAEGFVAFEAAEAGHDVGDYFHVNMKVDTVTAYQEFGEKYLNFRWDYHIAGRGVNDEYGIVVDSPNTFSYIKDKVYYSLTDAS